MELSWNCLEDFSKVPLLRNMGGLCTASSLVCGAFLGALDLTVDGLFAVRKQWEQFGQQ